MRLHLRMRDVSQIQGRVHISTDIPKTHPAKIWNRLERLGRRKILSRDDPLYISRLFKSRWQPLPAYIGIIGCSFIIIWSGIPPLYILVARESLTSSDNLKSTIALAFDVIGAYVGVCIF